MLRECMRAIQSDIPECMSAHLSCVCVCEFYVCVCRIVQKVNNETEKSFTAHRNVADAYLCSYKETRLIT